MNFLVFLTELLTLFNNQSFNITPSLALPTPAAITKKSGQHPQVVFAGLLRQHFCSVLLLASCQRMNRTQKRQDDKRWKAE